MANTRLSHLEFTTKSPFIQVGISALLSRRCWRFAASVAPRRVNTRRGGLKRALPPCLARVRKRDRTHACDSPNHYAKPAPQKTKNTPATNRNQSAQRASRSGIKLTRKVCDVTIGRAESPALFRTLRRSREKAATKQDKEPTPFGRRLDHNCPRCGQFRASSQGVPI